MQAKAQTRVKHTHLGFVSASVTWRMKIPSSGCSVSSISYMYDDAIASVVPSLLKASDAMLVGYRWNWHSRFLLNGSQIFTNPSEPPASDLGKVKRTLKSRDRNHHHRHKRFFLRSERTLPPRSPGPDPLPLNTNSQHSR